MDKNNLISKIAGVSLALASPVALGISANDLAGYRSDRDSRFLDFADTPAYSHIINGREYMLPGRMKADGTRVRDIRFENGEPGKNVTLILGDYRVDWDVDRDGVIDGDDRIKAAVASVCGLYSIDPELMQNEISTQIGDNVTFMGPSLNPGCYSQKPFKGDADDITQITLNKVRNMYGNLTISDNGGEGKDRMYLPARFSDNVVSRKVRIPELGDMTFLIDQNDGNSVVFMDGKPGNYDKSTLLNAASSIGVKNIGGYVIKPY